MFKTKQHKDVSPVNQIGVDKSNQTKPNNKVKLLIIQHTRKLYRHLKQINSES